MNIFFQTGHGHLTKMSTMSIYGSNPSKTFFRSRRPMALGLDKMYSALGTWVL